MVVGLPSTSECSAEFNNSYQSWLFTPPSVMASSSRDERLVSPLHNCAILQEERWPYDQDQEHNQSTAIPLLIQVRKARVLLFASVFLTLLLTLVVTFAYGVPLVTIEGSQSEEQRRELVNSYNFYSGTTSSLVAKPFELAVSVLLPVMYLVFATKLCLYDDSLKWRVAVMVLQALFVTMLTSAFSSLYVQQRQPQISPVVIDADLFSISNRAPPSTSAAGPADPFALKSTADTILSTTMQSAYVKGGVNPCKTPGEWLQIAATHSIASNPWLKDLLPRGLEPTKSVQVTIGELLKEKKNQTKRSLPFNIMTATNLLLHAMINSETILPWILTSGLVNSTFDMFLWNATVLNVTNDEDGFLYAASLMLNKSLDDQASTLNYSSAEATLNFSHFDLSSDIVFDAVTIDIPFKERLMERKLRVKDIGGALEQVFESKKKKTSTSAVYDVGTARECGVDACLIEDPLLTGDEQVQPSRAWNNALQVQAFAPCAFGNDSSEDITVEYLHGEECKGRLNTSILIYSMGKRIVADEMVLDPPGKYADERMGYFTNIRRYQTITMGRLSWKTQDLASRFNAVCNADQDDCRGLSFQLEGNFPRHLVIGEKHLPLDVLGPFMGMSSQWTPLVMLTSSVKGDLLFKRNVKKNANWTAMDGMCSDAVETFARQIDGNRLYMEYGLQEAYTAALFFLFQNAAVHEERQRSDKVRTLNFSGSHIEITLEAKIPLQSALFSICGSVLLLLGVFVVVVIGKRKEHSMRDGLDAHRVAKVLLVDQSFPKVFLQCTIDDPQRRVKKPLEHFHIQSLSLKQLDYRHRTGIESSAAAVSAAWQNAVIQLPPQHDARYCSRSIDPISAFCCETDAGKETRREEEEEMEEAEGANAPLLLARSSRTGDEEEQGGGRRATGESAPASCATVATPGAVSTHESSREDEGSAKAVSGAEPVVTADTSASVAASVHAASSMKLSMPTLTGSAGVREQERGEMGIANGKQDERKEEPISEVAAHPLDEQRALELRAREMELFQGQLEKEMLKRRPDHFIIGVICRSLGGVPDHMRSSVWKEILGVTRSERLYLDQSILRVEEDLENQKVISADACRTRGNDAYFKQPETVELITKLLTYYCKCRNVRYKQGMNEVLAPFLILERDPPMPEGVVFQCFYAMIDKFLPHVFVDREFKSLQCSFQLYRLLMLYHDPKLCHYLDQHDMTPELYVTPWFMTLFARNLKPELVFLLWDFFLLEEHPFLMHFIAYAMVDASKDKIMSAEIAMLPQVLSSITFGSKSELEAICAKALQLAQTTPRSFERDLYSVCYGGFNDSMLPFMRQISGASSLQVYPDELVANLLKRISAKAASMPSPPRPSEIKREDESLDPLLSPLSRNYSFSTERNASASSVFFIVLDCRPIEQYRECHLSLSYHIDPEVTGSPDALSVLIKGFSRMKGCHFCFVGPSDPSSHGPKSSNIAFDTISRLARGISGEKKSQVEAQVQAPPVSVPSGSNLPVSPGVPGSGANDIISKEGAASGNRPLYFEHISVTRLVLMFLQKGFEHISRLDGGFEELKKEIMSMDTFTQEQLLVHAEPPSPPPASASTGFKLFSKIGLTRLRSAHSEDMTNTDSETAQQESSTVSIISKPMDSAVAARPKAKVATFSQRFQTFTAAAKDAVSQGANSVSSARLRSKSNPDLTSPVPEGMSNGLTDERQLVGEEEWVEVCLRTKEALEKSLAYKEVVFQTGSMGILLQKSKTSKKYQAVVDSIVPESQASESQQMDRGDLLVSVNGQSMENVPFLSVIDLVKDAKRPVVLRFQNPNAKKALESFDAISIPPLAPTLVSASHHSIGITWSKLSLPNIRYHLQYAKQSEFNFNPWVSVVMKQDWSSDLSISGITEQTNGTMVGLDPGQSFVFRVRCGDGDKWGPYSLSSNPISTLENSVDETSDDRASESSVASDGGRPTCGRSNTEPVFLPGSCPVFVEHGLFYYKVIISLRARKLPAFDAEKLDIVFEKGFVIKCTERMVAPGTNQIFVRIASDDASVEGSQEALDEDQIIADTSGDEDDVGVWAFENTPEGTVVLERLPEEYIMEEPAAPATIPLQEQAKSVVSSIFSGGAKSGINSNTSSDNTRVVVVHVAPKILQVFPVSPSSIVVTWDPINDVGVTKYQIQYSKNRLTAMWWNANQEIQVDTLKYTVNDLMPNTAYLFRIRGFNSDSGWGPYSESSESCRTPPVEVEVKEPPKPEPVPAPVASEGDNEKDEQRTSSAGAAAPDRSSTSRTGSGNNFRLPVGSIFSAPSSSTANTPPLRTGSTFLDKAVAAASRLTARRRSLSSSSTSASSSNVSAVAAGQESDEQEVNDEDQSHDQMMEEENGITYVNLGHWKKDPNGTFQDFRFYAASQYDQSGGDSCGSEDANSESYSTSGGLRLNKVGERDLVVTPTSLFILNSWASKREGFAVLEHSRMLESLVKITSQKSVKNLVVFHFKNDKYTESADAIRAASQNSSDRTRPAAASDEKVESEDASQDETDSTDDGETLAFSRVETDQLYFVVNDPDACVGLVRHYYEQLMS